ncbi:hypothetical protein H2202_009524 [Exophiala xenobiotica]|nr:hypothetical protein H2202_009524 [Exophiala xenobiotica]KAK5229680.1 hypothetical protein LTR72_001212 [Exophiala xenobiotica]KAK5492061.1 hypothetical protein LTR55_003413 [Exophiala xenobiotica]
MQYGTTHEIVFWVKSEAGDQVHRLLVSQMFQGERSVDGIVESVQYIFSLRDSFKSPRDFEK